MNLFRKLTITGVLLLCGADLVLAAPTQPRSVKLPAASLFERESGKTRVLCGRLGGRWLAGIRSKSGGFISNIEALKALRKDFSKARTNAARAKLRKSLASAEKKEKRQAVTCRSGPSDPVTPTPTPTPAPTAVPTQPPSTTPTPIPSGCYNVAGNTSCFGVPQGIVGNISRGQTAYQSLCQSCHSMGGRTEPRNRSYSQLQQAFRSVPQMSLYDGTLATGDVADLVAYLNRFNPNQ